MPRDTALLKPAYDLANSKADRLLFLADFMEGLPDEKVNIGSFWCGSVGCAVGWASQLPEFQKLGLYSYVFKVSNPFFGMRDERATEFLQIHGADAWKYCFTPDGYPDAAKPSNPTGTEIAAHLREAAVLVAEREAVRCQ